MHECSGVWLLRPIPVVLVTFGACVCSVIVGIRTQQLLAMAQYSDAVYVGFAVTFVSIRYVQAAGNRNAVYHYAMQSLYVQNYWETVHWSVCPSSLV